MTTKKPAKNKQEAEAEPKAEGPEAEGAPAEEPKEVKEPEAEGAPAEEPKEVKEPEAEGAPAEEPKEVKEPEASPPAAEPPPSPPPPSGVDRRDFWDTAATYLKKAKDEVVRSSRVGKLRLDIARIKKQRKDLYTELGDKAYELLSTQSLAAEGLEKLKVALDEKNALIAAKAAEIEATATEEAEEEAKAKENS